jgi:hypothetical protein
VEEEVDMGLELRMADTDMGGLLVEEAAERMAPHWAVVAEDGSWSSRAEDEYVRRQRRCNKENKDVDFRL